MTGELEEELRRQRRRRELDEERQLYLHTAFGLLGANPDYTPSTPDYSGGSSSDLGGFGGGDSGGGGGGSDF